ncbi:MAG: hypothetical protein V1835_04625 [Candidatus Micrarchaeota archaeon]
MPISPEMQRRMVAPPPQIISKQQMKEKIQSNMDLLRVASGAHSIQGFGRMTIGAIVLSIVFSFATLVVVVYDNFTKSMPQVTSIVYPVIAGFILVLFYEAVTNLREGFIMFEQSKGQEDAALEKFAYQMLEDIA